MTGQVFRLPDLGEGLTEAEVLDWRVQVGDTVTVDQIVVEVETAKAAVDVPVPFAGVVVELHAPAGTAVAVGAPLITVGAAGPAVGAAGPADADTAEVADAAERHREEERAGSGNVLIGYGTGHAPASTRRRRRAAPVPAEVRPAAPLVISPLVRRLAREHGIDLARLPGGPGGVVRRQDVDEAIARTGRVEPAEPVERDKRAEPVERTGDGATRIPLRGLRRTVAEKLTRSRAEIPDATTWVDVDATALLQTRDVLRGRGIGLFALLARICVAGLRRFPELNATVDTDRQEIVQFAHVHLGFAAQTERGLVVPVVRDAHRMTTAQLAEGLAGLTGLARTGGLTPQHLGGGTFTLNNYGVFGVDGSTPIINHPEAALLGIGRIIDKPWVVDGALAVRKVTQLSLTFDHRVCDGGVAGGFLRYVADCVEQPAGLLADL